jgi:hypothetical protein
MMEHLLPDGEGNYINLRHVSVLAAVRCMATDCQCADQDGYHVAASISGRRTLFLLNTEALPTEAAAQLLLRNQLTRSLLWLAHGDPPPGDDR